MLKIKVIVEEAEAGILPRYEERDPIYGALVQSAQGEMEYSIILNDARSLTIGVANEMNLGLTWAQAQAQLALGSHVTRQSYRDGVRVCLAGPTPGHLISKRQFAILGRAGQQAWSDWRPQTDDLFAGDWMVVPRIELGDGQTDGGDVLTGVGG